MSEIIEQGSRNRGSVPSLQKYGIRAGLVLLALVAVILGTNEFRQQVINGLSLGAIYALIALGYTMIYGVLRFINFAHGDVFMVGAFISFYAARMVDPAFVSDPEHVGSPVNALVVLLITMVGCGMLGVIIEFFVYRPLRNRPRLTVLITAIGVSLFLEYTGQLPMVFGADPQTYPILVKSEQIRILGGDTPGITAPATERSDATASLERAPGTTGTDTATSTAGIDSLANTTALSGTTESAADTGAAAVMPQEPSPDMEDQALIISSKDIIVFCVAIVLMLLLRLIVLRTKIGTAMRAVSMNMGAASLMGINLNMVIAFTFFLGSALAGAGSVLYAMTYPKIDPLMGVIPGLKAFVAAVLGGIGNIPGAALGGFLIGTAETMTAGYLDPAYRDAIVFGILILILVLKPSGLLGKGTIEKV